MISTHFDYTHEPGKVVVAREQDVEDIIENNKKLQKEAQKSDWGRHIGEIPNIFLEKWLNEEWQRGNRITRLYGPEMTAIIKRKLADPDYRFLRVDK